MMTLFKINDVNVLEVHEGRVPKHERQNDKFYYNMRHGDNMAEPVSIEKGVFFNHFGVLVTDAPLEVIESISNDDYGWIDLEDHPDLLDLIMLAKEDELDEVETYTLQEARLMKSIQYPLLKHIYTGEEFFLKEENGKMFLTKDVTKDAFDPKCPEGHDLTRYASIVGEPVILDEEHSVITTKLSKSSTGGVFIDKYNALLQEQQFAYLTRNEYEELVKLQEWGE